MATDVERLIVTLEATTKQYERALAKAQGTTISAMRRIEGSIAASEQRQRTLMSRMGTGIANSFAAGFRGLGATIIASLTLDKVVGAVKNSMDRIADLADLSDDLGVSVEALQVFGRAMVISGGKVEDMNRAIADMTTQLADADSAMVKFLEERGITTTGKKVEDLIVIFLRLVAQIDNAGERLKILGEVTSPKVARKIAEAARLIASDYDGMTKEMTESGTLFTKDMAARLDELRAKFAARDDDIQRHWDSTLNKMLLGFYEFAEKVNSTPYDPGSDSVLGALWRYFTGQGGGIGGSGTVPGAKVTPLPEGEYTKTSGGPRAQQATQILAQKYGQEVAAGIVAGMMGESGANLNPAAVGAAGEYGIAQWHKERRTALFGFTGSTQPGFDAQMRFLLHELETSKSHVSGMLKNAKSAEEALAIWVRYFEMPADIEGNVIARRRWLMRARKDDIRDVPNKPVKYGTAASMTPDEIIGWLTGLRKEQLAETTAYDQSESNINWLSRLAEEQRNQLQQTTGAINEYGDALNNVAAGALQGFVNDLMSGVEAGEALSNMLRNLASQLVNMAIQNLFSFGGAPGGLFGSLFGGKVPAFQHGGRFRVGGAGGTDSSLVAFRATPGEMVTVSPRGLRAGGRSGGAYSPSTAITVNGNMDEQMFNRVGRMIEANNQRQRQALHRDFGQIQAGYQMMRGP